MSIRFLLAGDTAISIQFSQEISMEINLQVRALQYNLESKPIEGIIEVVPTYSSLMIHYQPEIITYRKLKEELEKRIETLSSIELPKAKVIEIPIVYGGKYGPDLEECAKMEHITPEELIKIHSGSEYYVYMLGFAPGHPYMARFERPFSFKRREAPRVKIPGGSIVAAQNLSNLIPFDQPCGWNILGVTPLVICDYQRKEPFLVNAGQWVKFVPITETEYEKIKQQVEQGIYHCKTYDKAVEK